MRAMQDNEGADRVRDYARQGPLEAQQVASAKRRCSLLNGTDEYWEAVWSLLAETEVFPPYSWES